MSKHNKKGTPLSLAERAKAKFYVYNVKEPVTLIDFLMKARDGISRTTAKNLLSKRVVYVDHVITTRHDHELKPGMKVQISKNKGQREFNDRQIKLVYEDSYILVVEKKEGLLTAGTEKKERSVVSVMTEYIHRTVKNRRAYPLYRLDKDVSGLLLLAKDEKTKATLLDYWHEIIIKNTFIAAVSGDVEQDKGAFTSWIKDGKVYTSPTVLSNKDGEKATTYYKTIKRANGYSLVECDLGTGRKNQIRSHLAELGHPVLGDDKSGNAVNPVGRLALHAFRIHFRHPITGETMKFETPYPSSFKKLFIKQ